MPLEQILAEEVQMTFDDCYEFAEEADFKRLKKLLHRQFEYNMAIAEEGMKNSYGSNIGKLIIEDSASIADKATCLCGGRLRCAHGRLQHAGYD